ncbi:unnamed protein product [Blepharisma stoltei]|uniref:Cyclic nucleotide-binding domain-containing protein n=1 Tax=Blepharisma stoltei TaxID=1481888 RepID=A0AAU9JWY8_9CILI|nr:unnamed protein product [Blepharisma stoltei]
MNHEYDCNKAIEILQKIQRLRSEADIEHLMRLTSNINFFQTINEIANSIDIHKSCCKSLTLKTFLEGESIVKLGDRNNNFYIILRGEVGIYYPYKKPPKRKTRIRNCKTDLSEKIDKSDSDIDFNPDEFNDDPKVEFNINIGQIKEQVLDKGIHKSINDVPGSPSKVSNEKLILHSFESQIEEEQSILTGLLIEYPNLETVKITMSNLKEKSRFNAGNAFGELGIISSKPRAMTAIATKPTVLAYLSKKTFRQILSKITDTQFDEKIDILRKLTIFSKWSKVAVARLCESFKTAKYNWNQPVYNEGDPVANVYFVKKGEFKITKGVKKSLGILDLSAYNEPLSPEAHTQTMLKLGNMRKINKKTNLQLVIKAENEMVGGEEIIEGLEYRVHSCHCCSIEGELIYISKEDFTSKFPHQETWNYLKDKQNYDSQRFLKREVKLKEIEEMKSTFEFSTPDYNPRPKLSPINKKLSFLAKKPQAIPKLTSLSRLRTETKGTASDEKSILNKSLGFSSNKYNYYLLNSPKTPRAGRSYEAISPKKNMLVHKKTPPPNFLITYRTRNLESRIKNLFEIELTPTPRISPDSPKKLL